MHFELLNLQQIKRFKTVVFFVVAYVLGQTYYGSKSVEAGNGGFIVSHKDFDEGAESHNYYSNRIDNELTITGLTSNDTVRLTFITFKLHYYGWKESWLQRCDDYLEISSIRGYENNRTTFCGYDNPASGGYDLYSINNKITFRFVTNALLGAAGFLLKYEGR